MQCPVEFDAGIEYSTGRWEFQKLSPGRLAVGGEIVVAACMPPVREVRMRDRLSHAQRNGQVVRGHAWGFDAVKPVELLNGSLRLAAGLGEALLAGDAPTHHAHGVRVTQSGRFARRGDSPHPQPVPAEVDRDAAEGGGGLLDLAHEGALRV